MLPKKQRIDRQLFKEVWSKGKSFDTSYFSLTVFSGLSFERPKISFVVPKNVCKKATERNLLRRQGYAVFRELSHDFSVKKGLACIVVAKKTAARLPFFFLKKEMQNLFQKTGLIKNT